MHSKPGRSQLSCIQVTREGEREEGTARGDRRDAKYTPSPAQNDNQEKPARLAFLLTKEGAIDAFPASPVSMNYVASLDDETPTDSVKRGAQVVKRTAVVSHTLLARAQTSKVLCRPRHQIVVQLKYNAVGAI